LVAPLFAAMSADSACTATLDSSPATTPEVTVLISSAPVPDITPPPLASILPLKLWLVVALIASAPLPDSNWILLAPLFSSAWVVAFSVT
jgi:hypothetical protein